MSKTRKALVVATVGRFLNFEKNDIKLLTELGYEVHCAANYEVEDIDAVPNIKAIKHQIEFSRSPFSVNTLRAYRQIRELLEKEKFDLIHCHTPVGGILTRLAARRYRKTGTKVFYTAHGFHFFKGAPLQNWILFYPIEWLCAFLTDVLITINTEDYERAKKQFNAKNVEYIPGIGIDLEKYKMGTVDIEEKRKSINVKYDEKMLLSVGELSKRKNHILVIQALAQMDNNKIKYFICGQGVMKKKLEKAIRDYNLEKSVYMLGYREDISELCQCADLFVFPSLQEGLPVALMEAMACKVPIICSNIRGNIDLIENPNYRFSVEKDDEVAFCIQKIFAEDREHISRINYSRILEFDIKNVSNTMRKLYINKMS